MSHFGNGQDPGSGHRRDGGSVWGVADGGVSENV